MKRCPACRRDYYDDSLLYCLDDGTALLEGPAAHVQTDDRRAGAGAAGVDEPATAILPGAGNADISADAADQSTRLFDKIPSTGPMQAQPSVFTGRLAFTAAGLVLLVVIGSLAYRSFYAAPRQIESIAVMPFSNDSGNPDGEYLSDGITETLIKSLSQLPKLAVKSRSTVFAYKGKQVDPKTVGNELGVQAVLLGRLTQRGEALKLSLELVNAQTQDVIWTDQYDRRASDLITLQNQIAQDVSSKLRIKLTGSDQQKLAKIYTNDPEAYRLYLQARFYLNKRVGKLFDRAEGYLRQAIERDPNFALGYAGLAEFIGQRDRQQAKAYALRALVLDPDLSEAHTSLGYQYLLDYNWAECERELARAAELDPKNAQAFQMSGSRLLMMGRYDEAIAAYDRAIEIEPTLADIRNNRAAAFAASGKLDEAIDYQKRSMEMDPSFAWSHSHISFMYRMKGDHDASVAERALAADLLDMPDEARKLRDTYRTSGWNAYVRELLQQNWGVLGRSGTRVASFQAELGDNEQAIASLIDAAARGDWWLFSIKYDPAFDGLRGDPRFKELLKKVEPSN